MRCWAPVLVGVRALILDLDGTLVDRDAALRAWLRRRTGLGGEELDQLLALDRADRASLVQLGVELHRLRPGLGRDPGALVERIRGELPEFIEPDPAIPRALARLVEAGVGLALISNGGPGQRRKLARARIPEGLFEALLISGEFGRAKPDPAIFQAGLAALGVAPGEAMMIGDSPDEDIAGAAALGIRTCWISGGRRYPDGRPRPSHTVRALRELLG